MEIRCVGRHVPCHMVRQLSTTIRNGIVINHRHCIDDHPSTNQRHTHKKPKEASKIKQEWSATRKRSGGVMTSTRI